jgi:hypothetical protein
LARDLVDRKRTDGQAFCPIWRAVAIETHTPPGRWMSSSQNPDGQSDRLAGGYTFAFPGSLDVNGQWEGRAGDHWDFVFRFTVENGTVTSGSCDRSAEIRFSSPPSTNTGEFSAGERGVTLLTGEFFSPAYALGEINMAPCTRTRWEAWKR